MENTTLTKMLSAKFEFPNLKEKLLTTEKLRKVAKFTLEDMTDAAFEKSQELCPVNNGFLKKSAEIQKISELENLIIYKAPYGIFVEYGCDEHDIYVKTSKALSFKWPKAGNKRVFFKKVHHPGNDPQPFLRPGVDEAKVRASEFFFKNLQKYI